MSRTYRRKKANKHSWISEGWYTSEFIDTEAGFRRVPFPKHSKEYKQGLAKYRADHGTTNLKEPGPSWFRNLFYTRPSRVAIRGELAKFRKDSSYEVISDPICYLPYWT